MSAGQKVWVAGAHIYVWASTLDEADKRLSDWIAETMPLDFIIGWTMSEATDEDEVP